MYSSPETGVKLTAENVVITTGGILANYLLLSTLAGPGDHVICQYPTFSQLFLVPQFQGAEVSFWKLKRGPNSWEASLDELKALVKPNTKAVIIKYTSLLFPSPTTTRPKLTPFPLSSNPNNPTGAVLPASTLSALIALAASHPNLTLISDEVFRPLFHASPSTPASPPPSLLSLPNPNPTPNTAVTTSMSKAFGLPGIRLGWVASPNLALLRRIMSNRNYTTHSVSQLDQAVAAYTLSPAVYPQIIAKNLAICAKGIEVIGEFVERNKDRVEWISPQGAGVAIVRFKGKCGKAVDDGRFAEGLVEETGVMVIPVGRTFGQPEGGDEGLKGYVRIGLGVREDVLRGALREVEGYLGRFE